MKQRTLSAIAALVSISSVLFLLSGCATTTPSDQTAAQSASTATRSLHFADVKSARGDLTHVEVPDTADKLKPVDLASDTDDLFQRIRQGFSMPDINNDLVLYHQQWYLNRPDYLRRMVERSSRYMHFIVEELEKRGMPMELALLPMVESAYNPMAYSRSNASGLWQFIPATGKRYNLEQDWWRDDRRDIVASTSAALDYLQTIYELHGDWQLALASYNWGEGAVGRAIAKNKAQGLPTDYESLSMPNETKNYVPKLQALKNIFRNTTVLAELGLPKIINRPFFATVTKDADIDVKVAAKLAEMPVDEFVALNPSHNRPVIKSQTPLVIPAEKLETFMSNLEEHESSNKPLSLWQTYTLKRGEKLEKVAPRFGISVANLKAINGIQTRAKLSPGLTLLVPKIGAETQQNVAALPNLPQPATPAVEPARIAEAEPPAAGATSRSHTVRKGDTLPAIAKRYGISVAEIKRLNHLKSEKLAAGTKLTIATAPTKVAAAAPAEKQPGKKDKAVPEKRAEGKKAAKVAHYTVRRGDTLYSIAKQFKVDTDDLARWNRVSPSTLTPGKTLTIQLAQNP